METVFRHQCLVYEGAPSRHITSVAAVMSQKLSEGYRCLYLNSPPMVAGMRSHLAATGVDVLREAALGHLVLEAEQQHLVQGRFEVARMIDTLDQAVDQALADGYAGLWASGDMAWEFGPDRDFTKLLSYERGLEELFSRQPTLCGICQYHADMLPEKAIREGLTVHPGVFINETMSFANPYYTGPARLSQKSELRPGDPGSPQTAS